MIDLFDGFYYLDPTWDHKKKNALKYFMTEIDQIKNIGSEIVDWNDAVSLQISKNIREESKETFTKKLKYKHCYNYREIDYSSVSKNKAYFNDEYDYEKAINYKVGKRK